MAKKSEAKANCKREASAIGEFRKCKSEIKKLCRDVKDLRKAILELFVADHVRVMFKELDSKLAGTGSFARSGLN